MKITGAHKSDFDILYSVVENILTGTAKEIKNCFLF